MKFKLFKIISVAFLSILLCFAPVLTVSAIGELSNTTKYTETTAETENIIQTVASISNSYIFTVESQTIQTSTVNVASDAETAAADASAVIKTDESTDSTSVAQLLFTALLVLILIVAVLIVFKQVKAQKNKVYR